MKGGGPRPGVTAGMNASLPGGGTPYRAGVTWSTNQPPYTPNPTQIRYTPYTQGYSSQPSVSISQRGIYYNGVMIYWSLRPRQDYR